MYQRRKGEEERGSLDLIDFPMREMMCMMREGGRGGDGEPDRDKRKIDNVSSGKVREGSEIIC